MNILVPMSKCVPFDKMKPMIKNVWLLIKNGCILILLFELMEFVNDELCVELVKNAGTEFVLLIGFYGASSKMWWSRKSEAGA